MHEGDSEPSSKKSSDSVDFSIIELLVLVVKIVETWRRFLFDSGDNIWNTDGQTKPNISSKQDQVSQRHYQLKLLIISIQNLNF